MEMSEGQSERYYFHTELQAMIRTRYGRVSVYEIIATLDLVKNEVLNDPSLYENE